MPRTARRNPPSSSSLENIRLTSPGRVVYSDLGLTKLDLAKYYAAVADWILPHIIHRPLSLVRCPEGVGEACFFQKHPPPGLSQAVGRIAIEEKDGPEDYVYVRDAEGLLSLIQFGVLEIHTWGSRIDRLERPDRMVFDLDPDPLVGWKEVVRASFEVRELLEELQLRSFVKTSGGKGLHVVVPLDRKSAWPEVKQFSKAVADRLAASQPDRYVSNMSKTARKGKIFVDYLRNDRGSTSIAAYSTRARKGATVSVPLDWKEVSVKIGPGHFHVNNVPRRLATLSRDPWEEIDDTRQTLRAAARRELGLT